MAFQFLIQAVMVVVSSIYQRKRQRQLQEEADKRKGFEIAVEGEAVYPALIYGRNRVAGVRTYHAVKDDYVYASPAAGGSSREPSSGFSFTSGSTEILWYRKSRVNWNNGNGITRDYGKPFWLIRWNGETIAELPAPERQNSTPGIKLNYQAYAAGDTPKTIEEQFVPFLAPDGYTYFMGAQTVGITTVTENVGGNPLNRETYEQVRYSVFRSKGASRYEEYNTNMDSNISGDKNEFLFVQQVISAGGIDSIIDVEVDNRKWDHEDYEKGQVINVYPEGGEADAMATANGIPATNKFPGHAYASMCFRLDRDEYNYNGVPDVSFYVKGRRIRDIHPTEHALADTPSYSNNPALVLLDYLTNKDFGGGLTLDEIDLDSFRAARDLCNTTVMNGALSAGKIHGFREGDDPETGTRDVPLYECNIILDMERKVRENVDLILETMGSAELVFSGGVYKLQLIYPANLAAENALVAGTVTEEDVIRLEDVKLQWPAVSDRFNQATVRYRNEHENFKDDSATWPLSYSGPHQVYLREDAQRQLKTSVYLPGCTDPYHALAKAESLVRASRRAAVLEMVLTPKFINLEPGDLIAVSMDYMGLKDEVNHPGGEKFKVETVEITPELNVKVQAVQFTYTILEWNVTDDAAYVNKPVYDFSLPVATGLTVVDKFVGDYTSTISWTAPVGRSPRRYRLSYKLSSDNVWTDYGITPGTFMDFSLPPGTYDFAIVSEFSEGIESYSATLEDQVISEFPRPTGLTATAPTDNLVDRFSARLSWAAPLDFNPSEYRLAYRLDGTTEWFNYGITPGLNMLVALPAGTYDFAVVAVYGPGSESFSDILEDVVINAPSAPFSLTTEVQPDGFTVSVTWAVSNPEMVDHFIVEQGSSSDTADIFKTVTTLNQTLDLMVGSEGTTNWFWVTAVSVDGVSTSRSTPASATSLLFPSSVLIVYADDELGTNQSTTAGSRQYVQYVEYSVEDGAPSLPVSGTFVRFTGDTTSIWPIFATNSSGSSQSFTASASRPYVNFYESTEQPTLPLSGLTWVKYIGDDGRSITGISKSGQNVTVTYSSGTPDSFTVRGISSVSKVGSTLTITYDDGTISQLFDGDDGKGIASIVRSGDTVTITYDDSTSSTYNVTDGVDAVVGVIEFVSVSNIEKDSSGAYSAGFIEFDAIFYQGGVRVAQDRYRVTRSGDTWSSLNDVSGGSQLNTTRMSESGGLTVSGVNAVSKITYSHGGITSSISAPTSIVKQGLGISAINKSGDDVTVTYDNGSTDVFTVNGVASVNKVGGVLTVTFDDGSTQQVEDGDPGVGIASINRSGDVVTITYDDATFSTYTVTDGVDATYGDADPVTGMTVNKTAAGVYSATFLEFDLEFRQNTTIVAANRVRVTRSSDTWTTNPSYPSGGPNVNTGDINATVVVNGKSAALVGTHTPSGSKVTVPITIVEDGATGASGIDISVTPVTVASVTKSAAGVYSASTLDFDVEFLRDGVIIAADRFRVTRSSDTWSTTVSLPSGGPSVDTGSLTRSLGVSGQNAVLKIEHSSGATATQVISLIIDGANGATGSPGTAGDRTYTGTVYYNQLRSTTPGLPSETGVTFNESTGQFSGGTFAATTGWRHTQPTVDMTDTGLQEWSCRYTVTVSGALSFPQTAVSGASFSFSSIYSAAQITTNIESDNYDASNGWRIERNTGNAWFNDVVARGKMQSPNYSAGSTGWLIDDDGSAEFNDVDIRSTIQSPNFVSGNSGWRISQDGSAEFNDVTISEGVLDMTVENGIVDNIIRLSPFVGAANLLFLQRNSSSALALLAQSGNGEGMRISMNGASNSGDGLNITTIGGSGSTGADIRNTATGGGKAQIALSSANGGYAFFAVDGDYLVSAGHSYSTFTGSHHGMLTKETEITPGDILVDILAVSVSVSDSFFEVGLSDSPEQKGAIGVYSRHMSWGSPTQSFTEYEDTHDKVVINALGEGAVNVCGEGGDIKKGDLIVTSSIPGKGMRQSDDLVRAHTVAKAREDVSFDDSGEVKLVACIYLCG